MAQPQVAPSFAEQIPQSFHALRALPIVRQMFLLVGIAAAVAGGFHVFQWSQQPGHVELIPEASMSEYSAVAAILKSADIEHRVDTVSGRVTVPGAELQNARMVLAEQGLPASSSTGFEMMQQDPGLGVSSFLEGARYNHALETELGRSVSKIASVKSARVHLAIPKPSAFARTGGGASASVLVELFAGRRLEANQVAAITHMVASSVNALSPDRVTVVDQFGRLLSESGETGVSVSMEQFEYTRRVEADLARRVEQILLPITGPGKVQTQVSAEVDFSVVEEARETYQPEKAVVRSEQVLEQVNGELSAASGVPGALSNQPPETQAALPLNELAGEGGSAAESKGSSNRSSSSSRQYEIDRTLSHTRKPIGRLEKISVAVLIDDITTLGPEGEPATRSLTPEELSKIGSLVRDAVGFDQERGDRVTVQNLGFMTPEEMPEIEAPPMWKQPDVQTMVRHGFGLLAVLVLIFAVVRPALKSLFAPQPPRPAMNFVGGPLPVGAAANGQAGIAYSSDQAVSEEDTSIAATDPYDTKLEKARAVAVQDPKRVAQVVKSWLNDEEGG